MTFIVKIKFVRIENRGLILQALKRWMWLFFLFWSHDGFSQGHGQHNLSMFLKVSNYCERSVDGLQFFSFENDTAPESAKCCTSVPTFDAVKILPESDSMKLWYATATRCAVPTIYSKFFLTKANDPNGYYKSLQKWVDQTWELAVNRASYSRLLPNSSSYPPRPPTQREKDTADALKLRCDNRAAKQTEYDTLVDGMGLAMKESAYQLADAACGSVTTGSTQKLNSAKTALESFQPGFKDSDCANSKIAATPSYPENAQQAIANYCAAKTQKETDCKRAQDKKSEFENGKNRVSLSLNDLTAAKRLCPNPQ